MDYDSSADDSSSADGASTEEEDEEDFWDDVLSELADDDSGSSSSSSDSSWGDDPGHRVSTTTSLVRAIQNNESLEAIQGILDNEPELAQQPVRGMYPLSYAVAVGSSVEIVRAVHRCWPESVRAEDAAVGRRGGGGGGCLPLHYVTNRTPIETVEYLVDVYPEALRARAAGREDLPIHACIRRHGATPSAVQVLARHYPESLLIPGSDGCLPVHLAVMESNFELTAILADRCPESLRMMTYRCSFRCAGTRLAVHVAAESFGPDQLRILQFLAQRYPESLGVATNNLELAIHLAAKSARVVQRLGVMAFLADQNPGSLLAATAHGHLPVHLALQSILDVPVPVIQRLAVEAIPEGTRLGLMHFMVREVERVMSMNRDAPVYVLDNMDPLAEALPATLRARDSAGSLPIHVALHLNVPSAAARALVERLVGLDPECLLQRNASGQLPIHLSFEQGRHPWDMAQFLLERCPESALVAGRDGNLPIHMALTNRWFQVAKSIVELRPQGAQGRGTRGRTPMHVFAAVACRRPVDARRILDTAKALVRNWPESLRMVDADNNLPIHVAIECQIDETAIDVVSFLAKREPGSLRVAGAGGRLALHLAVSQSFPCAPLVKFLVDEWSGALDVRDASGRLPLHVASSHATAPPLDVIYCLVRASPTSIVGRHA